MTDETKQPQEAETPEETPNEENQAPQEEAKAEEKLKTLEAENKKLKAIADRKAKQLEKVKSSLDEKKEEKPKEEKPDYLTREQWEAERFYDKNPEYEPYKEIITALKVQGQGTEAEIVKSDVFNNIYEKAKKGEEADKSKSVLQTNPKLGQAIDKMGEAQKASIEGQTEEARQKAVDAVMDAFEL